MINDWLSHIEFAYPWVSSLLMLLPIIIFFYFRNMRKQQASMLVTTTHFLQGADTIKTSLIHLPFILRCFAIACLI